MDTNRQGQSSRPCHAYLAGDPVRPYVSPVSIRKYVTVTNLQPLLAARFGSHHSRRTRTRTRVTATTPGWSDSIEASQQVQF